MQVVPHCPNEFLRGSEWLHEQCETIFAPQRAQTAPVQSEAVQARVPFIAPVAAVHAWSALGTRVDRNSTDTILRNQHSTS